MRLQTLFCIDLKERQTRISGNQNAHVFTNKLKRYELF